MLNKAPTSNLLSPEYCQFAIEMIKQGTNK